MIAYCSRCQRKVLLKNDGACPGCSNQLGEPELPSSVPLSDVARDADARGRYDAPLRDWDDGLSRPDGSRTESFTPDQIKKALKKAKPLSDPGGAFVAFMAISLGQGIGKDLSELSRSANFALLAHSVLPITSLINLHILFRLAAKRAIFLRAFSRDILAKQERHFLFSSMPKGVKLEGIRAPRERSSWFYRLLIEPIASFHYLGAPNFSLEGGDHNWLARLLATLSHSRFVLVDVRTVTKHVAIELGVCWKCCGPDRLFFVVNESRSKSEWLNMIAEVLQVPVTALHESRLLSMPYDLTDTLDAIEKSQSIRAALGSVPKSDIVIGSTAFAQVRSLVPERSWKTHWYELPYNQFWLALFSYLLLMLIPMMIFTSAVATVFFLAALVFIGLVYFTAYGIAIGRALEIAQYDLIWRNPHGLSHGYVMFAALVVICMLVEALLAGFS